MTNCDIDTERHEYLDDSYNYKKDEYGRVISASGELEFEKAARNTRNQQLAGGVNRLDSDDGGHLIASRFGGMGDLENLVAMDRHVNRSIYKKIENEWAQALKSDVNVSVDIEPFFSDEGERPTAFMVKSTYLRDGESVTEDFFSTSNIDLETEEFSLDEYDEILPQNDSVNEISTFEREFAESIENDEEIEL